MTPAEEARQLLASLGVEGGRGLESRSPIDGVAIGGVAEAAPDDVMAACERGAAAFPAAMAVNTNPNNMM